jgi:hypothetical protein
MQTRDERIDHEPALLLVADETAVPQDAQVMGCVDDGNLEHVRDVADISWSGDQEPKDLQPFGSAHEAELASAVVRSKWILHSASFLPLDLCEHIVAENESSDRPSVSRCFWHPQRHADSGSQSTTLH